MSIAVGLHFDCRSAEGPKAYEVRNGERWLTALEGGEIRCWTEYHLILIDERTGHLTIEGGYGTWSYGWPNVVRGGRTLHSFLYTLNFDYFMDKAAKQPYRVADIDATISRLQREILGDRRQRGLEAGKARELWDILEYASHDSADELVRELYRDGDWSERLDCSDPTVMVDHAGMRRFWNEIWRPFCEQVLRPFWLDYVKQQPIRRARALVKLAA